MKVTLISTNRERIPSFAVPRGLSCLQAALEMQGHCVSVLDLCFESDRGMLEKVRRLVRRDLPGLVGISIRNVDNETLLRYRCNVEDVKAVVDACRENCHADLVLGGPGFSLMPEPIMRLLEVPFGVVGEGEEAICRLANALERDGGLDGIPGLVRLEGGRFFSNDPAHFSGFSDMEPSVNFLPDPRYFDTQVVGPQPAYGIQTKRGCAFRCSYCPVPGIEGKRFRLRAPERVAAEIKDAESRMGIMRFFITDSVVNVPKRHAIQVCRSLVAAKTKSRFMAYATPLKLDGEMAGWLRDAGCETLNFGLDAACPEMLANLSKDFDVPQIVDATRHCKAAGIRVVHSLLLGGPGETPETIRQTLATMAEVKPHLLTIAFGIRLYPQSPLWEQVRISQNLKDADLLEPLFFVAPELDGKARKTIHGDLCEFIANHPKIIVKTAFSPNELLSQPGAKALASFPTGG